MQAEYEAKVAAIKAEGERRKEEELRRRQQRYATIDRLQAAAANQVRSASYMILDSPSQYRSTKIRTTRLVGYRTSSACQVGWQVRHLCCIACSNQHANGNRFLQRMLFLQGASFIRKIGCIS